MTSRSAILYQNSSCTVTLIDIPTSIAVAQGRSDTPLSTPPLEAPIESKENYQPKSQKSKASKAYKTPNGVHHAEYKALVEQALAEIQTHVSAPWCVPRRSSHPGPQHGDMDDPEKDLESRMREWAACTDSKGENASFDLQKMMASLSPTSKKDAAQIWVTSYRPAYEATNSTQETGTVLREEANMPWMSSFHNPELYPLDMSISQLSAQHGQLGQAYRFTIPPRSTFFLSDSTHPDAFRASFREITDEYTLPRHFDLVLLDPPWPNRSAKRKGAYEQAGGMPYMTKMLMRLDLDSYLEHNALVGIWITNKELMREYVVGQGGLFETWNVGLIEEWVWIKTTTKGDPIFNIDDPMRKPYEILLLGRAAPNAWTTMTHASTIKKRVIAAVPDIHSRKPCLQELFQPHMPHPVNYSALEVFSRNLVSGWTSWGNEVLKYSCDYYWASDTSHELPVQHQLPIRIVQ